MATEEISKPVTYAEAVATIAAAVARGGRVMCGMSCGREATLMLVCEDGTFQGVACPECWARHCTMMEAAQIWEASGMAESFCSRCGAEPVTPDHIRTEPIASGPG